MFCNRQASPRPVVVQRPPVQFSDGDHAVLIVTNLGQATVEFLRGDLDADSIAVTYTYGMNTGARRMMHAYDFAQPKGNEIGWATSDSPLYFTLHHRWFIQSSSECRVGCCDKAGAWTDGNKVLKPDAVIRFR